MGEDALHVELPKATGEASGSRNPQLRARPVPPPNRVGPLLPALDPDFERRRLLFEAARRRFRMRDQGPDIGPALRLNNALQIAGPAPENPEAHLPQPQPGIPNFRPILRANQHPQQAQQAQLQRVLARRLVGNNLGAGNGPGDVRMDRMDRGREVRRRRRRRPWDLGLVVPRNPGDRVALSPLPFIAGFITYFVMWLVFSMLLSS